MFVAAVVLCFVIAICFTPSVKNVAIKIGAIDRPNGRKIHQQMMPRLGGLSIYISFLIGFYLFIPNKDTYVPILLGATTIVIVGIVDDILTVNAKVKLMGQMVAAIVTVLGGVIIDFITIPTGLRIEFEYLSIPITILWIIAITNAINLIDGLDGLAAGVSSIALVTIAGLALSMGDMPIALLSLILLGSTLGFLLFNFYPAKIFMGDTGSLFLGYMLSVISILGLYKEVTLASLLIPIIILGIPIIDTTFAIIRRVINRQPLSTPDKFHLHHCILRLGYTHRQTVIMIYALSIIFSLSAVVFTQSTYWGALLIIVILLILIELIVEVTGLISDRYRPILNWMESAKFRKWE